MAEALWASGGSYGPDEDRKLIAAIFRAAGTGGVVSGMAVSPGVGLNVTIEGGVNSFVLINDGDGGAYLHNNPSAATLAITGNTSGSVRVDTVYATVNATTGIVTYGKTTGGTTIPALSTRLASVSVPNNATALTAAAIVNNPGFVDIGGFVDEKYLRNDTADTLFPGTNAYTPTTPNNVATKGYVDGGNVRTPHHGNKWGGQGYGPWYISDGNWNVPPGSAIRVANMIAGHLYDINVSGYTAIAANGIHNILVRSGLAVSQGDPVGNRPGGGLGILSQHHTVVSSTVPNASGLSQYFETMSQKWYCGTSGNYWFYPVFATNSVNGSAIFNQWDSPYTEITDLGPMGIVGSDGQL
jgi:hypothetical protein